MNYYTAHMHSISWCEQIKICDNLSTHLPGGLGAVFLATAGGGGPIIDDYKHCQDSIIHWLGIIETSQTYSYGMAP